MRPRPPPSATGSGQFATPPDLALDIARYALDLWQGRTDRRDIPRSRPSAPARFTRPFARVFPTGAIADACGVEIDPAFADAAQRLWAAAGLRVIPGDFTTARSRPAL